MTTAFSKKKTKQSSSAEGSRMPTFDSLPGLEPLLGQILGTGSDAFGRLRELLGLGGEDLVAGRSPQQEQAEIIGTERALDPNGIFATSRNTLQDAAGGQGLEGLLPPGVLESLLGFSSGAGGTGLSPELEARLTGPIAGTDRLSQLADGSVPIIDSLRATAAGEGLDSDDFMGRFNAALNSAIPNVRSTFGRGGGSSAQTGGLSRVGETQVAADAFAGLTDSERNRQLQAGQVLQQLGLQERGQTGDILSQLGNFDQNQNLLLGNLAQGNNQNALNASRTTGELAGNERRNQLNAAAQLPGVGNADIDLLNAIGMDKQQFEQLLIDAPQEALFSVLEAILGGPGALSPLFGEDRQQTSRGKRSSKSAGFEVNLFPS